MRQATERLSSFLFKQTRALKDTPKKPPLTNAPQTAATAPRNPRLGFTGRPHRLQLHPALEKFVSDLPAQVPAAQPDLTVSAQHHPRIRTNTHHPYLDQWPATPELSLSSPLAPFPPRPALLSACIQLPLPIASSFATDRTLLSPGTQPSRCRSLSVHPLLTSPSLRRCRSSFRLRVVTAHTRCALPAALLPPSIHTL